jgi:N-acetyl-gamma-glutamyl-phosphate reductase
MTTVFIDGEAGTTGLQIRERLAGLSGVTVNSIDPEKRKDASARKDMMASADCAILCLPDDAAREAVEIADALGNTSPRILDASTAHRTNPEWVYGFAELTPGHNQKIAAAARVANPGCYATGAIALIRPLINVGLLAAGHRITINAVSGYSGGGKSMIASYETVGDGAAFELYALGLSHKHLPEIAAHGGLDRTPVFVPSVGNFRQGMLVSIPLHLDALPGAPSAAAIEAALKAHYQSASTVSVVTPAAGDATAQRLDALALNDRDDMQLFVYGSDDGERAVLVARLDNLGKGAAGAAVQNLSLMFGL